MVYKYYAKRTDRQIFFSVLEIVLKINEIGLSIFKLLDRAIFMYFNYNFLVCVESIELRFFVNSLFISLFPGGDGRRLHPRRGVDDDSSLTQR